MADDAYSADLYGYTLFRLGRIAEDYALVNGQPQTSWRRAELKDDLDKLLRELTEAIREDVTGEMLAAELDYSKFRYALVNLSSTSDDPGGAYDVMALSDVDTPDMNCVISLTDDGTHYPMIDLDFSAHAVPSSTRGHAHLIIDGKRLDHLAYKKLIDALNVAGLLEHGNVSRFDQNGFSVLRKPTTRKGMPPDMNFVSAPWTAAQCMQLRRWQSYRNPVAYYCRSMDHYPEKVPLRPGRSGWRCPHGCAPYKPTPQEEENGVSEPDDSLIQEMDWTKAPRFMFDPRLIPCDPNLKHGAAALSLIDLSASLRTEPAA